MNYWSGKGGEFTSLPDREQHMRFGYLLWRFVEGLRLDPLCSAMEHLR